MAAGAVYVGAFICLVNCLVLWSFTFMFGSGNYTFAVLAAENGWDRGAKTAACRNAAIFYMCVFFFLAVILLLDAFLLNFRGIVAEVRECVSERRAPDPSRFFLESVFSPPRRPQGDLYEMTPARGGAAAGSAFTTSSSGSTQPVASSRLAVADGDEGAAGRARAAATSMLQETSADYTASGSGGGDGSIIIATQRHHHHGGRGRRPYRDYIAEMEAENANYYTLTQFGQDYVVRPFNWLRAKLTRKPQTAAGQDSGGGADTHASGVTVVNADGGLAPAATAAAGQLPPLAPAPFSSASPAASGGIGLSPHSDDLNVSLHPMNPAPVACAVGSAATASAVSPPAAADTAAAASQPHTSPVSTNRVFVQSPASAAPPATR